MRAIACSLFLLLAASAQAGWADLRPGMDQDNVRRCIGHPILQNRGKGGAEIWTYDHRGYVEFYRGRLSYYSTPTTRRTPEGQASTTRSGAARRST